MILSMTGFARHQGDGEWGSGTWEIRSVNQRFLDISFRLPENLRCLEPGLRDRIRHVLHRGKIECYLRYDSLSGAESDLSLNQNLVHQLMKASQQLALLHQLPETMTSTTLLSWPGVVVRTEPDLDLIQPALFSLFDEALQQLIAARQQEGAALRVFIAERLTQMKCLRNAAVSRLPELIRLQREKMMRLLSEMTQASKAEADPHRLEQELVFMAQRSDVAEELDRLQLHIEEMERSLAAQQTSIGRRLDFIAQEMNREANTLTSKALDSETTHDAIELKILIEQIREQVQNIE